MTSILLGSRDEKWTHTYFLLENQAKFFLLLLFRRVVALQGWSDESFLLWSQRIWIQHVFLLGRFTPLPLLSQKAALSASSAWYGSCLIKQKKKKTQPPQKNPPGRLLLLGRVKQKKTLCNLVVMAFMCDPALPASDYHT